MHRGISIAGWWRIEAVTRILHKPRWLLAAAFAITLSAPAVAEPSGVEAAMAEASALCQGFENGVFSVEGEAVIEVDLTGDGTPDALIDQSTFRCSSSAGSMWCGTGGCGLKVIADGVTEDLLVKDWQVIDWHDRKILLTAIHGAECGGTNLRWCYEALVWSEGGLRSVSPSRQQD
jgi:hypothetical protein